MVSISKIICSHPYSDPNGLLEAVTRALRAIPANVPTAEVLITTNEGRSSLVRATPKQHVSVIRWNDFDNTVHYEMVVR